MWPTGHMRGRIARNSSGLPTRSITSTGVAWRHKDAPLPLGADSPNLACMIPGQARRRCRQLPAQTLCRVRTRGTIRMSLHSPIAPARRRTFTPYVLLYLLAASLAVAYLTFLGARPDLVALWRGQAHEQETGDHQT